MKVAALVSGGKDSCFNMMKCVADGHKIVCLANLNPPEGIDELDSYMYQTVGHDAIGFYSEAMALPLHRKTIKGLPLNTNMNYEPNNEDDEVEDLYVLLKELMSIYQIEAVSVGAIFSEYQKVRVENVCHRLGLKMLAYLWHRDQAELMTEMIRSGLHAILIKVAALGLEPDRDLGKSLSEIYPRLLTMSEKYGLNVCGEGGEFESFVIDCPLFKKRIEIDESELVIHSNDAFAPVGYLRLKKLHLVDKCAEKIIS